MEEKLNNKKRIIAVPHTHWDREWYFTINDAALLSTMSFEKIIKTLEDNPDYPSFCLDGQTSIYEDFVELRPDLKERIGNLIKNKRIFIGPWHTQTDSFLVDGESYIRNLYFGSKLAEELGHSMTVGYLPDTFGHNIQTPQLFKGFGLKDVIFWRGYDKQEIPDAHFKWTGLDGSSVLACNLTWGYSTNVDLDKTHDEYKNDFEPVVKEMLNATKDKTVLFPIGGDQVLIDDRLPHLIKNYEEWMKDYATLELSNYEEFFKELRKEINVDDLQEVTQEFRMPITARVHRTISSSRYDIKKLSFELEHKIIDILEPLSIIISEIFDDSLINKFALTKMWKLLLDGHAHDSIGACNTDITNENVLNRFKRAENLVDGTINIFKKIIGSNILKHHNNNLTLFNFDVNKKHDWFEVKILSETKGVIINDGPVELDSEVINIEEIKRERKVSFTSDGTYIEEEQKPYYYLTVMLKADIPSFGYKSFNIREKNKDEQILSFDNFIENEKLKISFIENSINILDKEKNIEYKKIIEIENTANDGDSYDFSPLENDVALYDFKFKSIENINNKNNKIAKINGQFSVPVKLENRKYRSEEKVIQDFTITIKLFKNKIGFKIKTINKAKDHRFRIRINHKIEQPTFFTDVPFGFVERKFIPIPVNWKERMVEQPVNYYQIINTAYIKGDDHSLQVNTKGIKEIEITEENNFMLTLYKSDGWLGKPDLQFRPNRASGGEVPSPEAQMIGKEFKFEFELIFTNSINERRLFENKKNYIRKFDFYQMQNINTTKDRLERFRFPINEKYIENEYSLFKYDGDLQMTSSYISYKDKSIIFRFVNLSDEKQKLGDLLNMFGGEYVDFAERSIKSIDYINKYKAITIKRRNK